MLTKIVLIIALISTIFTLVMIPITNCSIKIPDQTFYTRLNWIYFGLGVMFLSVLSRTILIFRKKWKEIKNVRNKENWEREWSL